MKHVGAKINSPGAAVTRGRLLEAAACLFAEKGFHAVSVRDVTRRARANLASVGYHFGSKEQLFVDALCREVRPLNESRMAALAALEAAGRPPPLRAVLDAFARSMVTEAVSDPGRGMRLHRLLSRAFAESDEIARRVFRQEMLPVALRFLAAIRRAVPGLPAERVGMGIALYAGCVVHALRWAVQPPLPELRRAGAPRLDDLMDSLVGFGEAGFRSLARAPAGRGRGRGLR
jgi:AcrR family transcriptional regulator